MIIIYIRVLGKLIGFILLKWRVGDSLFVFWLYYNILIVKLVLKIEFYCYIGLVKVLNGKLYWIILRLKIDSLFSEIEGFGDLG